MAAYRRRTTTTYNTYGSVAYAPAYDGSAVRAPRREEELYQPAPQPKQREKVRRRELVRAQAQVREAGQVAPFAVVGFLAVAIFAVMLVMSYAQLMVANNQMVTLRDELSDLQAENATLTAEYEKVFDMERLQETVGGTMVRPGSDQVVYIDLSAPDAVTVYGGESVSGVQGALDSAAKVLGGIVEYFR